MQKLLAVQAGSINGVIFHQRKSVKQHLTWRPRPAARLLGKPEDRNSTMRGGGRGQEKGDHTEEEVEKRADFMNLPF